MKLFFCCFFVLLNNSFVKHQDVEIVNYKKALTLVLSSNEFKEYGLSDNNYQVSSEIIRFSNFDSFFKYELNKNITDEIFISEVIESKKQLLKLNRRKYGKVKIFFSEQKENVFFAEVFTDKKKNIEYKNRPLFGSSKVYMFKNTNEKVFLITTKDIHYN